MVLYNISVAVSQISQMRAGNVKDNMQLTNAQEEIKKLKNQLGDKNAAYAELASKVCSV